MPWFISDSSCGVPHATPRQQAPWLSIFRSHEPHLCPKPFLQSRESTELLEMHVESVMGSGNKGSFSKQVTVRQRFCVNKLPAGPPRAGGGSLLWNRPRAISGVASAVGLGRPNRAGQWGSSEACEIAGRALKFLVSKDLQAVSPRASPGLCCRSESSVAAFRRWRKSHGQRASLCLDKWSDY